MKISSVLFSAAALASSYLVSASPLPSPQDPVPSPAEPKWSLGQTLTCGTLTGLVVFAADQTLVSPPSLTRDTITSGLRAQWEQQTTPFGTTDAGNSWELRYYPDDTFWSVTQEEFDCLVEKTVDQLIVHSQWASLAVRTSGEEGTPVAVLQWYFNEAEEA